jgi:exodeoxyribonuclease VII small subunit
MKGFEKDFERMKSIARDMESAKSFEETMKLFREGMKLSGKCKAVLEEAELEIEELARL